MKIIKELKGYNIIRIENLISNKHLGDNLLRFYSKQIVDRLKILNRYNYVHFDLKP